MDFFHNFFSRFTAVVRSIVAIIIPIAESKAGDIISAALPFALQIVSSVGQSGATGIAARNEAVAQLKAMLIQKGIEGAQDVENSVLNFVIETALQHQKATTQ